MNEKKLTDEEIEKETAEKFAERLKESVEIQALRTAGAPKTYKAITQKIDEILKEITGGKV